MRANNCQDCYKTHGHLWDRFTVSKSEAEISACPKCGSRHVEVTVFEPGTGEMRTKSVAEGPPMEEGQVPVVTVTFEREELYVLPEIAFRYYEAPEIEDISDDIPSDLAKDWIEGQLILRYSPRSAALLARRILQQVLNDRGYGGRKLHQQIDSFLQSGELSSVDVESLRAVCKLGNIAAHTTYKEDTLLEVERHEAKLCLQVVAELLDHCYVKPAELARINQKG